MITLIILYLLLTTFTFNYSFPWRLCFRQNLFAWRLRTFQVFLTHLASWLFYSFFVRFCWLTTFTSIATTSTSRFATFGRSFNFFYWFIWLLRNYTLTLSWLLVPRGLLFHTNIFFWRQLSKIVPFAFSISSLWFWRALVPFPLREAFKLLHSLLSSFILIAHFRNLLT